MLKLRGKLLQSDNELDNLSVYPLIVTPWLYTMNLFITCMICTPPSVQGPRSVSKGRQLYAIAKLCMLSHCAHTEQPQYCQKVADISKKI